MAIFNSYVKLPEGNCRIDVKEVSDYQAICGY